MIRRYARFAVSLLLLSGGCTAELGSAEDRCLSTRDFFVEQVWLPVMSQNCIHCHSPEGEAQAEGSAFRLQTAAYPGFLEANFENAKEMIRTQYSGESILLLKPLGELDHGGGPQLVADSTHFAALSGFKERVLAAQASDRQDCTPQVVSVDLEALSLASWKSTLRKASLNLVGRLPTAQELDDASSGARSVRAAVTAMMGEPAFLERIKEIYNDRILTAVYEGGGLDLLDRDDYPNRGWFDETADDSLRRRQREGSNYGIGAEALELIAHVIKNDRPFTEVVTADYTVVNPYSARVYGVSSNGFEDPEDPYEFREAELFINGAEGPVRMPHAGVLTTPVFLQRFPSTDTNLNRHRARMVFDFFLATDVLKLATRPVDPASITSNTPTRDDPSCYVCHKVMDPVASAFQVWDNRGRFRPDREWPREMPQPGLADASIESVLEYPNALNWLGHQMADDPRFVVAAVRVAYRALTGRDPMAYPDPGDDDFRTRFLAWQAEDTMLRSVGGAFVRERFDFKALVRGIVTSPHYRALAADPSLAEAWRSNLGTARLLTPELLSRKIRAVSGGVGWTRNDGRDYLTQDYRTLYGGIDSENITVRLDQMNGLMLGIADRMANEMACRLTAWDFTRDAGARTLFPHVELTVGPEDLNGYEVPRGVADIRKNIRHLYVQLLGRDLNDRNPEVDRAFDLFLETYRELKEAGDESLDYACRGRTDQLTGESLPEDDQIDNDRYFTVRSWMAVVAYLMSDYWFLHE